MKTILGLLSVLAVLCLAGSVSPSLAQSEEISTVQATSLPNTSGAFVRGVSDDGKRIVFESTADYTGGNADLNREIFVYDVDSRTVIQLTNTKNVPEDPNDATKGVHVNVSNNAPAISGDGTRIVFSSNAGDQLPGTSANPDGNQEIYLALLPRGATAATFLRVTATAADQITFPVGPNDAFDNYTPTINFDGTLIAFVSTRDLVAGSNADKNAEIFLYDVTAGKFTQVTSKLDSEATVNFQVRGFNSNPFLSGNGRVLVFLSGFDYTGENKGTADAPDFNGEIFLYNVGDPTNKVTQVTRTTGNTAVPTSGAVNLLSLFSRHLNHDGTLLVFESAGDFAGKNADKTREIFLYNTTLAPTNTSAFTQITDQTLPANPTATDAAKVDFNFSPSLNAAGTYVTFASFLNLTVDNDPKVDNADNSKEVFRYDVANKTIRQLTVTAPSAFFLDQRQNLILSYLDSSGRRATFSLEADLIAPNLTAASEIFQDVIRPITSKNDQAPALANAASFDSAAVARGSIVAAFGTRLAATTASAADPNLPFELSGVSVTVKGLAARLIFVSPGQVNFVLPQGLAAADAVGFTINNNGVLSSGTAKVVGASPGLFTTTGTGSGPAAALCGMLSDDKTTIIYSLPPCSVGTADQPNYLFLFGTGWRNTASVTVSFKVGDTTVTLTPTFAGPQPNFLGLDQINLTLTQDLAGKGTVDATVTAGGTTSKPAQVTFK